MHVIAFALSTKDASNLFHYVKTKVFLKVTCRLAYNKRVSHSLISYYLKAQTCIHTTKKLSGCKFNLLFVQHKLILLCSSQKRQWGTEKIPYLFEVVLLRELTMCIQVNHIMLLNATRSKVKKPFLTIFCQHVVLVSLWL